MDAVLFDIGSTLVQGPQLSPSKMIVRLLGLDDSEKERVADIILCRSIADCDHLCVTVRESLPAVNFSEEQIKRIWLDQETAPKEIPGATQAVKHIKSSGLKIGLVSDIWQPYYDGFLSACGELASLVDYSVLSFREGARKPSALLFEKALESLGAVPERTWMVGDTYETDIDPAIKMGMRTVWVLNRPEKECRAMAEILKGRLVRPDIIVDSIADLVGMDLT